MSYNIGLNVIEVDGAGAPGIAGATTSVAAFNVVTQRGLPNTPARINGFPEFVDRFGGFFGGGYGAYLVKGFFDNGGGTAYVNRVVAAGSTPASVILQDSGPAPTLRLEAGYRGGADPGAWGLELHVRSRRTSSARDLHLAETAAATVTALVALPATTDTTVAGFAPLLVEIDQPAVGAVATTIAFVPADFANPAAATPAEIVSAINARTNDLDASLVGSFLVLTSTGNIALLNNRLSSLRVTPANAAFGFTAIASAAAAFSPLGANGATLNKVDGLKVGDAIELTDGTVTRTRKVQSVNPATRAVVWTPALDAAVMPAGATPFDQVLLRISNLEFELTIYRGGVEATNVVETWERLSMESDAVRAAVGVINDLVIGSTWVRAIDEGSPTGIGANRPTDVGPVSFATGGLEAVPTSLEFSGNQATHTGFYGFDPYDVQLVTCERTDPTIAFAGIAYCEGRGDCMYVAAVPDGALEAGTALTYGQNLQGAKVYGAAYAPWILVADPIGPGPSPMARVPPVGHVMGTYARIDRSRGVWKAPAGDEARLQNVIDVTYRLTDAEHTNLVKNAGINGIRAVPRAGVIIDASRTLSTDSRWLYVNVRLLFNYMKTSLKQGLRWVRQEPNKDTLWNLVKYGSVTPFLLGLWRQGAFGTGAPSEVFTVICDATNNPPAQVQLGFLNVEVYIYPSNPAETIVIKVGQQPSGASATEA